MKRLAFAAALLATAVCWAGYSFYYTENFSNLSANWYVNGNISTTGSGISVPSGAVGALISKVAIPDGTSDSMVSATVTSSYCCPAYAVGTFSLYLRASANTDGSGNNGTYYVLNVSNSGWNFQKRVNGSLTTVGSGSGNLLYNGVTLRATAHGSTILLVVGDVTLIYNDSDIPAGQPGIGGSNMLYSSQFSTVQLGPVDRVGPTIGSIGISAFPNHVDAHWSSADDANGPGIALWTFGRSQGPADATLTPNTTDTTVQPSSTYTYSIDAWDYSANLAYKTTSVTTPPAGSIDPRQVGVKPTGTYWGALGEQIDLRSGNLNYTLPLLTAQMRGGNSVQINLAYNSTNWRQDPGGTWKLGGDVRYGFGWKLLAGSLTPIWGINWALDHYLFTDSTGAEYRLDQNSNNVWTSKDSTYVAYDANAGRLWFPNGAFWLFGCTSAGSEQDAGTMYPTLMEDSNGNQIILTYQGAPTLGGTNSSARISIIEDVRAVYDDAVGAYATYVFSYDATGHLTGIANNIGTAEGYGPISYASQTLCDPFGGGCGYGSIYTLSSLAITGLSLSYSFQQDSTGALTRATLPYGGYLGWQYANYTYVGSRLQPEVQYRLLSKDGTAASQVSYFINRDSGDPSRPVHVFADLWGPDGKSELPWFFDTNTSSPTLGLVTSRQDRVLPGQITKVQTNYGWNYDSAGRLYLSSAQTVLDPGSSQAVKQSTQVLDANGNVTQSALYDFTSPSTNPLRQYSNTYSSFAFSGPPFYKLYSSTVSGYINGAYNSPLTLTTNHYDGSGVCSGYSGSLASVSGQREHDDATFQAGLVSGRGNLTVAQRIDGTVCAQYDMLGNAIVQQDTLGRNYAVTYGNTSAAPNYAAPSAITTGSYSNTMSWYPFLGIQSQTGPTTTSATTTVQYDSYARPTQTTSVHNAITTYAYGTSPPTITATTDGHWTRTTLDGLGRTIKVETGDGSGTKSVTDTAYAAIALDPLGKVAQQSVPYKPGDPEYWTVYTYDGIGRATQVLAPDGASKTQYSYSGNTVTATDPANNSKTFTMDAAGNVTQVVEPGSLVTAYTYSLLNQLTQVQQTRNGTTQTRSWTYNGVLLTSTTQPESGTTTYSYNPNGTLASKTDARGYVTTYAYDNQARLTGFGAGDYAGGIIWDQAYFGGNYWGNNTQGRIAEIWYNAGTNVQTVEEHFSYDSSGLVTTKAMALRNGAYLPQLSATFTYNDLAALTSIQYPNGGPTYNYSYDTMGRLSGMTDAASGNPLVLFGTYGPAGEFISMSYLGYNEGRQYNAMKQLTRLTNSLNGPGTVVSDFGYTFPSGQNLGKISQMNDYVTGETVQYAYDSLLRLTSASSNQSWSQSFTYDGFSNLTNVNAVNAPGLGINVNAANNQLLSDSYDANGNDVSIGTYDSQNHLTAAGGMRYGYALDGKRIYKGSPTVGEYYFYAPNGQRLGTYSYSIYAPTVITAVNTNAYFGGRLIQAQGNTILTDRLGSNVSGGKRYFAYGGEKPSATTNEIEKFTGYFRDSETGLDYAAQRYYQPGTGRFATADPSTVHGNGSDTNSWNRYSYAGGDPINNADPSGLDWVWVGGGWCSTLDYNGGCYDPGGQQALTPDPQCMIIYQTLLADPGNATALGVAPYCGLFFGGVIIGSGSGSGGSSQPNPTPPSQQPAPSSCSLELEYRQAALTRGNHASLVVTDSYGYTITMQGKPQNYPLPRGMPPTWGNLVAVNQDVNIGDQQWGSTLTSSTDASLCDQVSDIEKAENYYSNNPVTYYPWGPNSNSLAHWLLESGYVDQYFTAPPLTFGWKTPLYGTILGIPATKRPTVR
jgi:RHS repeat-associated protein